MIFITGPHASGKTMIREMLFAYGFVCVELGTTLRAKHKETDSRLDFGSWCQEEEKIYGKNFTDDVIAEKIKEEIKNISESSSIQDLAIVGSRSLQGIEYIINKIVPINKRDNIIIYLDSPYEILKERYCLRENKQLTDLQFNSLLEGDRQIGIETIFASADFFIWNDGSEFKLRSNLERILFFNLKYSRNNCLFFNNSSESEVKGDLENSTI